jgi:hypothetical protein
MAHPNYYYPSTEKIKEITKNGLEAVLDQIDNKDE